MRILPRVRVFWSEISSSSATYRSAQFAVLQYIGFRLEGYVVRSSRTYSLSTITNHALVLMTRKMENLRSLTIENANISNVAFKHMPKSWVFLPFMCISLCFSAKFIYLVLRLERLCLTGSIIGYCAMDDLANPAVLPRLRHLNLDYVHNLSSNSKSFQYILRKGVCIKYSDVIR